MIRSKRIKDNNHIVIGNNIEGKNRLWDHA